MIPKSFAIDTRFSERFHKATLLDNGRLPVDEVNLPLFDTCVILSLLLHTGTHSPTYLESSRVTQSKVPVKFPYDSTRYPRKVPV